MKQINKKRYAIICSGGNAPGMNNIVISFCKKCLSENIEPCYFSNGYKGLVENKFGILEPRFLEEFINRGNAIIGSGRLSDFVKQSVRKQAIENLKKNNIDVLVVAGGDGSYQGAYKLSQEGVKIMCIPATIDNDVASTHYTVGFDTCLNQVSKIINDTNDCFSSHNGVNLIEIMGRACPDLTVTTGIGSNIYMITKFNILKIKDFVELVNKSKALNKRCVSFAITEKMYGRNRLPSLKQIADEIEKRTGFMTRVTRISYVQRGGTPSARDRQIANMMVNETINLLKQNKYNYAVGYIDRQIVPFALAKAIKMKKYTHNKKLIDEFNKVNLF